MKTCDVLIVGGGPAGSTCAWKLRHAGADVMLLDAATFPRDKVCAGWITPQVVSELALDVDDYRRSRTFQPITGFRVGIIGRSRDVETGYGKTVSYGIRRCEFDHYLLQRSGAHVEQGTRVTSIQREDGGWIVNQQFRTRLLVGAGGHFCPVARSIRGAAAPTTDGVVVAQEVEFAVGGETPGTSTSPERPELYFSADLEGYGWSFRKGEFLNVGIGRLDHRSLPRAVDEFLEFLISRHVIDRRPSCRWRGHAYAINGARTSRRTAQGALLVGDSAALAYPESGEGIRPAIESGLLAAEAIVAAKGDYDEGRLGRYNEALLARFGSGNGTSVPTGLLPAGFRKTAARVVLTTPSLVRHIVLNRWFLHDQIGPLAAA